jgi:hypothetical protein
MPEIHELRVLQTGSEGGTDALMNFITRMLAFAEGLGIRLGPNAVSTTNSDSTSE